MGLHATYWVDCDICGSSAGSSRLTQEDAWDYVQRGGWWVNRGYGAAVCEDCYDENTVYHAQRRNVSCVLCLSGEHVRIAK